MNEDARADDAGHGHDVEGLVRETSPMQEYSTSQVWLGVVVAAIGIAVAFVLPYLLA
jgi:ribosome modulation factor